VRRLHRRARSPFLTSRNAFGARYLQVQLRISFPGANWLITRLGANPALLLASLLVSREAVIRDRFPWRRKCDELAALRPDFGVVVKDTEAHAEDVARFRVTTEEARAAPRAEDLGEAVGRLVAAKKFFASGHAKRSWRDPGLWRGSRPGTTLAASAVAVVRGHEWLVDLEPHSSAKATAAEGLLGHFIKLARLRAAPALAGTRDYRLGSVPAAMEG
jgi:hypothetical protein